MLNQPLIALVNSVLGTGKPTARGNYAYSCPFCNHHKPKLEINFTENQKNKLNNDRIEKANKGFLENPVQKCRLRPLHKNAGSCACI